jgi:hypothetical protein
VKKSENFTFTRSFLPYHHEGEITAKISISSVTIEKAEFYDGPSAKASLAGYSKPVPLDTIINPNNANPDNYNNIREVL